MSITEDLIRSCDSYRLIVSSQSDHFGNTRPRLGASSISTLLWPQRGVRVRYRAVKKKLQRCSAAERWQLVPFLKVAHQTHATSRYKRHRFLFSRSLDCLCKSDTVSELDSEKVNRVSEDGCVKATPKKPSPSVKFSAC